MLSVTQLTGGDALLPQGEAVLQALSVRAGYVRGSFGRATDDPSAWVLVTEWETVGAYRRAIGSYDLKILGAEFFTHAADQPSAFEVLAGDGVDGGGSSDRAAAGFGRAGS